MAENWIRVVAHLSSAKVAQRLAPLCKGGAQHAAGVLQDFWSSAKDHSRNGYIRDMLDETLEDWARWKGKRGAFAQWVREHHMDADGRINDWDDFMGELELRREKARLKKARQRAARRQTDADEPDERGGSVPSHVPGPVPGDNKGTSPPYGTERNGTVRNESKDSPPARKFSEGETMLINALSSPTRRRAMVQSLKLWAEGDDLPNNAPKRRPTPEELSKACREAVANVDIGELNTAYVRGCIGRVMRGEPDRTTRAGERGQTFEGRLKAMSEDPL